MNVGAIGENLARQYLLKKDYTFLTANFRTRSGEIDLICKDNNTYVFVEVKTRLSDLHGQPYEAVGFNKKTRMKRAIGYYLLQNKLNEPQMRADVISIFLDNNGEARDLKHFINVALD